MNTTVKNKILQKYFFKFFKKYRIKTHKNNITLFHFPQKKIFRKISNNKEGIKKIISEKKGIEWYCKRLKKNSKTRISYFYLSKKSSFIDLKEVNGFQVKSWKSLEHNFSYLIKVFNHYKKFYPRSYRNKIHGDLTLDNVIFYKNEVNIIDWEFFGAKEKLKGYDLAYLFLSAACIPYFKKKFSLKDEKLFINLWKILIKNKCSKKILQNPFNYFEKNIKSDLVLNKAMKISKSKFFPFLTSRHHKKKILEIIKSINKYEK